MIEITDEMVIRFMTGGLRGYDIREDKYVDFTRKSARSFLEMVLNPKPEIEVTDEMRAAGRDAYVVWGDKGNSGPGWHEAVYRAMHAARPKADPKPLYYWMEQPVYPQTNRHFRSDDLNSGRVASPAWARPHRRSGDPI